MYNLRVWVWVRPRSLREVATYIKSSPIDRNHSYVTSHATHKRIGGRFSIKICRLTRIGIPIIMIRRSHNRLIFINGNAYTDKTTSLYYSFHLGVFLDKPGHGHANSSHLDFVPRWPGMHRWGRSMYPDRSRGRPSLLKPAPRHPSWRLLAA